MSDRFNCAVHGLQLVDNYNDGCPQCQFAEEDAARDREEIKKSLSEIARTPTNLGDYVCPYCMQTSLKAGASRCPLCRGEIGGDYWNTVRARQKADAERALAAAQAATERQKAAAEAAAQQQRAAQAAAAAELVRTAPERAAAARAAASAAASAAAERAAALGIKRFFASVAGVLVGGIAGFVVAMILGLPLILICAAMGNEHAANTIMTGIVVIGAIIGGVAGFSMVEK